MDTAPKAMVIVSHVRQGPPVENKSLGVRKQMSTYQGSWGPLAPGDTK